MEFDVPYLLRHLPALGRGLALTIQVSALAIVLSVFVGLVGASLRVMRFPVLSQAAAAYVEFIRNTPLLVQLFFVFFGLPTVGPHPIPVLVRRLRPDPLGRSLPD